MSLAWDNWTNQSLPTALPLHVDSTVRVCVCVHTHVFTYVCICFLWVTIPSQQMDRFLLPSLHPQLFSATCPWNIGPHVRFQLTSLKYLVLDHPVHHRQAQQHPPGPASGAQVRAGPWAPSSGHSGEASQGAMFPRVPRPGLGLGCVHHSL